MQKTKLSEISDQLSKIDIGKEPVVFMHSSLFQLGKVENGILGIMDVIWNWLGEDSTLLMPSFSYHNIIDLPWCAKTSQGKTGLLTEYFRNMDGVVRSIHPIHSITAFGKHADFFASEIESTSFGPRSPFAKLVEVNAMNVSLGANFIGGATFLHFAEEFVSVPYREHVALGVNCFDMNDKVVENEFKYFARKRFKDQEYQNDWTVPLQDFLEKELFTFNKIGSANLMYSRIGDTTRSLVDSLRINPFYCAEKAI